MTQVIQRTLLIVLLGGILGLVSNAISPKGIPLITPPKKIPTPEEFITLAQAHAHWSAGEGFFLDARSAADYEAGHIANALNVPGDEFDAHFPQLAPMLSPDAPLVVYCDGMDCELSHRLADQLRLNGLTNVHMLQNGWTAWQTAGFPVASGAQQ